jgi:phosphopantetheinyl transferase
LSASQRVEVPGRTGAPEVRLLDARIPGLDEPALHAWARAETAASGAPHVSRSYRYPLSLVAWHNDRVGIDIERVEPMDARFAASICSPSEREDLQRLAGTDELISSLWCSKEALSKALGDAVLYDPRRLESPMRWPDRQSGPWRAMALEVAEQHVAWLCWHVRTAAEPQVCD